MFETYDSATDTQSARRFALSTLAALGVSALLGVGAVTLGQQVRQVIREKKVDVVFRPPPPPVVAEVKPPPPPPPPPKPKAKPPPPPTVAAPAALVAPQEIPVEKPPETDAANAVAAAPVAVGGTGALVAGAIVTGLNSAGVVGGTGTPRAAPINLPESATPPRELDSNVAPEFPADMRSRGLEGLVILKIVVDDEGRVGAVKVMRGEEPFVGAAVAAVKSWRYAPALVAGQPTAVYRIVKIPFRLT
ncbi:energy transducer TonB [Archangium primigenium]|uniref:energy transducer TonB n=1 Tax=[Archangium] primigenium TaxID=2792470 RepID=UPI0019562F8C|nr:energy transducer TonB [Archangium primigenium]MBM7112815.1 TonB family protein [Archangium primigenium]